MLTASVVDLFNLVALIHARHGLLRMLPRYILIQRELELKDGPVGGLLILLHGLRVVVEDVAAELLRLLARTTALIEHTVNNIFHLNLVLHQKQFIAAQDRSCRRRLLRNLLSILLDGHARHPVFVLRRLLVRSVRLTHLFNLIDTLHDVSTHLIQASAVLVSLSNSVSDRVRDLFLS